MVMATNPPAAPQPAPATAAPTNPPNSAQGPNPTAPVNNVTPQSVGREFVRQYYTLLNKAPKHLHRFYTNASSFVHGGVDPDGNPEDPVYGQEAIHAKIVSLNFRDCHAKIRQVDSHGTVGEGVVVQVTGELSNNGEPMRRFMQTFVLAPQAAKKYFVRNDIFRYQDEVFQDDETESEPELPVECDSDGGREEIRMVAEQQQRITTPELAIIPKEPPPQPQVTPSYYEPQPPVSNGSTHPESPEDTPIKTAAPEVESFSPEPQMEMEDPSLNLQPVGPPTPPPEENHQVEQVEVEKQAPVEEPVDNTPKTFSWAERARGQTAPNSGLASKPMAAPSQVVAPKPSEPIGGMTTLSRDPPPRGKEVLPQREPKGRDRRVQERMGAGPGPNPGMTGGPGPAGGAGGGGGGSGGGRRGFEDGLDKGRGPSSARFPDSHQLFVGNLPQDITDKELRSFFSEYGRVVDTRINRNSGPKLPYFGFIVFDDAEPVENILKQKRAKPILLRGEHRLNVEEKKNREMRPPRLPRSDLRPGSGGPSRGGPQGRDGGRGSTGGGVGKGGGGGGRNYNPQR
ncbi:ras GTPase-activating protein-binding protein 2-like [Lytechinus pictus]|uniref:ras GTPase-activating protein-binding protein 2-like n=1 Tax=Lytechinus pictus TaxID=7653 RepID=UPI0030B9E6D6